MESHQVSVVINRPIEEVFENATCLRSCVRWMTTMTAADKVTEGNVGVGTMYQHKAKFMGINVDTYPTIRKYDPPKELVFGDPNSIVPYEVAFTFTPVEGGTRFDVTLESGSKGLINGIARPILNKAFTRQMQSDMDTLKELLEGGVRVKID